MKIGILGVAHGHVNLYCDRWKEHPDWGVTVAAGWDHNADRLRQAAGKYGFQAAPTPAALLAGKDIGAVAIAAETSLHAELVEQAAAAGKAIVLQKPIALTKDEADRIVAAVERHRVPFTLAWQMRVDAENLKMKELLASGRLGRIFMVRRRHSLSTHTWQGFETLWHNDPKLNRDIFADDAAHPCDFIYWLMGGLPATVTAELGTLCNPKVPNDNAIAVFRYADGRFAEVSCSFTSIAGENTTEIVGEKGVVIQNYGDGPSCSVPRPAGAISLMWTFADEKKWLVSDTPGAANQGERIAGLAKPIADFLHGRRPPIATAREGRDVLRMIQACYESHEAGQRVRL